MPLNERHRLTFAQRLFQLGGTCDVSEEQCQETGLVPAVKVVDRRVLAHGVQRFHNS